MARCNYCGQVQDDSFRHCTNCGAPLYQQPIPNPPPYQAPPYPQQPYASPVLQQPVMAVGMGEWIGWLIICNILPVFGPLLTFCSTKNPSLKNYCKIKIPISVINLVLAILFYYLFYSV